ncbi:MAG: RluA family pseudouridine synthase, partial [Methyloceanibacter sp.]
MARVETKEVGSAEDGMRLDRWFKAHYPLLPHSRLEKLLRTGQVRVDGARAKSSTRLAPGQMVRVPPLPDVPPPPSPRHRLTKAERDFLASITLYEDDDLLILNKPSGVAVQGGTKTPHHIDRLLEGLGDGPETR